MTCKEFRALVVSKDILEYLPSEGIAATRHIKECGVCRRAIREAMIRGEKVYSQEFKDGARRDAEVTAKLWAEAEVSDPELQ